MAELAPHEVNRKTRSRAILMLAAGALVSLFFRLYLQDRIGGQDPGDTGGRRYLYLVLLETLGALPVLWGLTLLLAEVCGNRLARWMSALLEWRWTILCAACASVLVSLLVAARVYHFRPITNGDEWAYIFQAKLLASGRLFAATPPDADAFEAQARIISDGRWYTQYFPGHPLLLTLGTRLGLPWVSVGALSFLTVLAIAGVARELLGREEAAATAVLFAISPHVIYMQASLLSQTSSILFLLLTIYFGARFLAAPRTGTAALMGLALGATFLARPPTAVTMGGTWALWCLWRSRSLPGRRGLVLAIALAVGAVFALVAYFAYNAGMTGRWFVSPYSIITHGDPLQLRTWSFTRKAIQVGMNAVRLQYGLLGWPVSFLFVAVWIRRRCPDGNIRALAIAACALIGFYCVYHAGHYQYWYESLIPALLITASGMLRALRGGPSPAWLGRRRVAALVVAGTFCSAAYLVPFLNAYYGGFVDLRERFFDGLPRGHAPALMLVRSVPPIPDPETPRYNARNDPDLTSPYIYATYLGSESAERIVAAFPDRKAFFYQYDEGSERMIAVPYTSGE